MNDLFKNIIQVELALSLSVFISRRYLSFNMISGPSISAELKNEKTLYYLKNF